jgi:hypothetical protein
MNWILSLLGWLIGWFRPSSDRALGHVEEKAATQAAILQGMQDAKKVEDDTAKRGDADVMRELSRWNRPE